MNSQTCTFTYHDTTLTLWLLISGESKRMQYAVKRHKCLLVEACVIKHLGLKPQLAIKDGMRAKHGP